MITEPGPNKILAEKKDKAALSSLKKKIEISINKHSSVLVAIVGHYDCAGNPANKAEQIKHIKLSIKTIGSWSFNINVIGLWIGRRLDVCKMV